MRADHDGMMLVRAELCERLESLQALSRRVSARDFTESVESLRRLAAAYGMMPVVALAEALERAVGEGGERGRRDCPTALYLARLQDAIGCERLDSEASEALLASISVRLC
ncbi:MAG TPA: hypothetical protein VGD66_01390 [Allosphingosinicella sp.]|jgi:hypothetical protein